MTQHDPAPAESQRTKLLGRFRELEEVRRALADAGAGRGRLLLLTGEPGIGKTSLADAASVLALERGMSVHWGRAWEAGGAPAYFPWLGILSDVAESLDDDSLARALGDGVSVLTELVPELAERLPHSTRGAEAPPDEARFRVWRAIVALLREASKRSVHGVTVVLDDLHAADRSSLLLLHFLARELRTLRLLVVATYRDVEAELDDETAELIVRIGREGTKLSLRRLEAGEIADFVRAEAGEVAPSVVERILAGTQGNPLFVLEMLRLLAEQGPEALESGAVPRGVREVIRQRLGRVSAATHALLELAAVLGDDLEPRLLAAALGEDEGEISKALVEATRAGVLVERGRNRRFAHALFREVLYRELDDGERRRLHGRVGDALERSLAPGSAVPYAELAHHALAGPRELLARGVQHAVDASRRATELLAYDEAVSMLEGALAVVTENGNSPELRGNLLVALGAACIRRGESELGKRHCREAADVARTLGNAELAARAALEYGRVFTFAAVDPILVGMLEESLEALPHEDSVLRARVLGRLAGALQPSINVDEPAAVAREAIATVRRLGDRRALLEVMHDALSALMDIVDPVEQRAVNLEVESLARELGDRERLLRTHGRLVFAHLALGELALADERIEAFQALSDELDAPWIGFRAPLFRAVRATMHGHFAEAEKLAEQARRIGAGAGEPAAERLFRLNREGLLRAAERYDELLAWQPVLRRAFDGYRFASAWQNLATGLAHARCEDEQKARLYLGLLPEWLPGNLYALFFHAEVTALAGTDEQVRAVHERLSEIPDDYVMLGMSYFSWEGPRARLEALLLERLGRFREAETAFEQAIERCSALDARPYLARCEYEYGRMLAKRDTPALRERAQSLLGSERARASDVGMPGLIRLSEQRLAELGGAPSSAAVPVFQAEPEEASGPSFRLLREGELFTLSFEGETVRLKDSLGLRYLARLVEAAGTDVHVLDLVRERAGSDASELADAGDAGELIDDAARAKYEKRLRDLRETLEEAESLGDTARAERAREELDFLARELSRAVGLGGRKRRAGVAVERARSAVQRRIRHALDRVEAHAPALARFLSDSITTGIHCCFRPVPR